MGENSGIQWTHHTFNPWVGCQRVSPGCTNCYAEAYDKRVGGLPKAQRKDPKVAELRWGPLAPRVRTSAANWRKPLAWDNSAVQANVAADITGKPRPARPRVFCSSLADVFEDRAELVEHRADLFRLILATPHLDWLLLTKRPENLRRMLPWTTGFLGEGLGAPPRGEPWPNVWLGTTVEDQQRADERIPELLKVPAVVRFLSMEPLLEPVNLDRAIAVPGGEPCGLKCARERAEGVDWVIIGGESGGGARPFELDWARDLVRQARTAGAAPFVKQLGSHAVGRFQPHHDHGRLRFVDHHGGDMAEWPEDLRVREFPR